MQEKVCWRQAGDMGTGQQQAVGPWLMPHPWHWLPRKVRGVDEMNPKVPCSFLILLISDSQCRFYIYMQIKLMSLRSVKFWISHLCWSRSFKLWPHCMPSVFSPVSFSWSVWPTVVPKDLIEFHSVCWAPSLLPLAASYVTLCVVPNLSATRSLHL